jgi:hypothetical protein
LNSVQIGPQLVLFVLFLFLFVHHNITSTFLSPVATTKVPQQPSNFSGSPRWGATLGMGRPGDDHYVPQNRSLFDGMPQGILTFLTFVATAAMVYGQTDFITERICDQMKQRYRQNGTHSYVSGDVDAGWGFEASLLSGTTVFDKNPIGGLSGRPQSSRDHNNTNGNSSANSTILCSDTAVLKRAASCLQTAQLVNSFPVCHHSILLFIAFALNLPPPLHITHPSSYFATLPIVNTACTRPFETSSRSDGGWFRQ